MNKQEIIKRLKDVMPENLDDYQRGEKAGLNFALLLIDELEKPVVPQFVADFYESIEDDLEYGVYELCAQFYEDESELSTELYWWFKLDVNKPIETLVKMKLYGYEVKKEKLYTVEIPNPNGFIRLVLCKDCDGKLFVATFSGGDCWETFGKCKLTESEIKKDFEWAWQFAKEVDE
jgi:hypothetical protein